MKVYHHLISFFILTLQDGNTVLVSAQTSSHKKMEGENITVECSFFIAGSRKFFCKEKCEQRNVLLNTTNNTAQNGRYSIEFIKRKWFWLPDILYVSIAQLQKSDSGWYTCYLDRTWTPDVFKINVTEASTTATPNFSPQPLSASTLLLSVSTTTKTSSTNSLNLSSQSTTPSSNSFESTNQPDPLLYVGLILVVMIPFLSAALLIFCKMQRDTKPKGPPVKVEYADITEASHLYEEILQEDRANSLPPAELSSVYATAKCPQGDGLENMDLYSLVTYPQNKAEDNLNEVDYSELDFSHIAATSSAPCGDATDVHYSTLHRHSSPVSHTKDASPPLYSSVEKHK